MSLILKDGTTYECTPDSNVANIFIPVETYAEVDAIAAKMTKENMETMTVNGVEFHDTIPVGVAVYPKDGVTCANFANREGTDDIIQNAIDNYTEMLIIEGVIE